MKHKHVSALILGSLILFILACEPSSDAPPESERTVGVDTLRELVLQSLQDADDAWNRSTVTADSFVSFFTNDALWLWVDGQRVNGMEQIRSVAVQGWERPTFMLDWEPTSIGINDAHDVGYTAGEWQSSYRSQDGQVIQRVGSYMAIWKKADGGEWKVEIEIEFPGLGIFRNQSPPPASSDSGPRSPTSE